jgi:hypothetical protein
MSAPEQPQIVDIQGLRAALTAPNMQNHILNNRAPGSQPFTVDEAMHMVQRWAQALHQTPRFPITTETVRHDDGTLTITVTPQP